MENLTTADVLFSCKYMKIMDICVNIVVGSQLCPKEAI
jgi:hypothetical protein